MNNEKHAVTRLAYTLREEIAYKGNKEITFLWDLNLSAEDFKEAKEFEECFMKNLLAEQNIETSNFLNNFDHLVYWHLKHIKHGDTVLIRY
tara:strand:- start:81180 stop:81452 length:273 start_codon:yes stop_codon:yes gene_type:complete